MIDADDLLSLVRNYNPKTNEALIRGAYDYARRMHEGQKRHSGEPYFTHPVAVAAILTEQRLDDATIMTALLHDTIEDTKGTYSEIAEEFGTDVAELVDGVTKLTNLELSSRETKQAENFRKLFMAMSKDLRVILVKLADRLHNMRTIRHMPPEKQAKKAHETMDIYAPLAGRMGMQWMRDELEDLSFRVLNPDARASIIRRFITLQKETGDVIPKITDDIERVAGKTRRRRRRVRPREKAVLDLAQDAGERARLLAPVGHLRVPRHHPDRGRLLPRAGRDSPALARGAGAVQGLHQPAEVERLPVDPHDGLGARRQAGGGADPHPADARSGRGRRRRALGLPRRGAHAEPLCRRSRPLAGEPDRTVRDRGGPRRVSRTRQARDVFRPGVLLHAKGRRGEAAEGATPIDFAYAIHTRIGHSCVGARLDGLRVPLWTRLKNGQSVEILTAEGQTPQATWLDIATTGRAKAAIRRNLREVDRERYIKLGRELARVAFEQIGKKSTDKALATAAKMLNLSEGDEVLARIGSAELSARAVVAALYPEVGHDENQGEVEARRAVIGLPPGASTRRAQCCQAVPGERIVGITYPGKGPIVHAIDCEALAAFDDMPDRWIDLHWTDGRHAPVHNVTVDVTMSNEKGVLGRICTLIGEQNANISDLHFMDRKPDFYRLLIDLDVRDAEHLHAVMMAVEADSDVAAVQRFRDLDRRP
jgi:guanosine-3',5'-bis(diphosphate) 3'-pyrophosphohydrolase